MNMGFNQFIRGSWTPFSWVESYSYLFSGPFNKPEIALTFDDGPDEIYTPQVLDQLRIYGAKGTFFVTGENVQQYPDMARRIVAEGHEIAIHSYDHPDFSTLTLPEFQNQILTSEEVIESVVGVKPRLIRPPYGIITEEQLKWTTEANYVVVQWSIDTLDWQGLSAEEITNTVVSNAFPGSIVLQHSAYSPLQGSVAALGIFIPQLQSRGVRFVTLSKMLEGYI